MYRWKFGTRSSCQLSLLDEGIWNWCYVDSKNVQLYQWTQHRTHILDQLQQSSCRKFFILGGTCFPSSVLLEQGGVQCCRICLLSLGKILGGVGTAWSETQSDIESNFAPSNKTWDPMEATGIQWLPPVSDPCAVITKTCCFQYQPFIRIYHIKSSSRL